MKKIYFIISCALLILSACDSRNTEKPDISVALASEKIYVVPNYEETTVNISLAGKSSQIQNALIDVEYDSQIINFIGNTGNAFSVRTDENGAATGTIYARKAGGTNIQFTVNQWNSSTSSYILVSYPEILSFEASPDTLLADGITFSNLTARIFPPLPNKYAYFNTNGIGDLEADSSAIGSDGYYRNRIKSSVVGVSTIKTRLVNYPTQQKSVSVTFN